MARELIIIAFRQVMVKPLRTLLTMLGIIVGVASVVTLVAIGRGTTARIEAQYESLGTNLLVVNLLGNGRATRLDYDELMQLELLPEFAAVAPVSTRGNATVKYERTQETFNVVGTNDRYREIMKLETAAGRFLSPADLEFRTKTAVLGSEVASTLFGRANPVGETVNIDGVHFTVVGVLKPKGSNIAGNAADSSVFIPLSTALRSYQIGAIRTAYFEAASKDDVGRAEQTVTAYLTRKFNGTDGFRVNNQTELLNARQEAVNTLVGMLVSVASISLLVGGIGIMNIMLVTVSERTREIGIRKSIGAKRRHILAQFLTESVVISVCGGLLGLLVGIAVALAWPLFNPQQTTRLSLDVGLYAFVFSALVGIVFGIYPAQKAARLNPIEALRFE